MSRPVITIAELAEYVDQEVTIRGWVYNWRKKGKLRFIILRDGCRVWSFVPRWRRLFGTPRSSSLRSRRWRSRA